MGGFDNGVSVLEGLAGFGLASPGTEAASLASGVYHGGSAVYDALTGDRDGAIAHGVQALYGGLTALPGTHEGFGVVDMVTSVCGLYGRIGRSLHGEDAGDVPVGNADLMAGTAVGLTNMFFGPDDSNWIAPGDMPMGTRGGEIAAGGFALGGLPGAVAAPLIGAMFGSDLGGPTSGARGPNGEPNGWAQRGADAWRAHHGYTD